MLTRRAIEAEVAKERNVLLVPAQSAPVLRTKRIPNKLRIWLVDRVVGVVRRRHPVVLGVHLLRGGRWNTLAEGQDHVGKNLETVAAAGVGPRWLRIPGMHHHRVLELVAHRAIRLADLEYGHPGS